MSMKEVDMSKTAMKTFCRVQECAKFGQVWGLFFLEKVFFFFQDSEVCDILSTDVSETL